MKHVLFTLAAFAICATVAWGLGGFIALNWDVRSWEPHGRWMMVAAAVLGTYASATVRALLR